MKSLKCLTQYPFIALYCGGTFELTILTMNKPVISNDILDVWEAEQIDEEIAAMRRQEAEESWQQRWQG